MMPVAEFRAAVIERPLSRVEPLMSLESWSRRREEEAREIVAGGWAGRSFAPGDLTPPIRWREICADNRSREFHLYCWDPLGPVLKAYEETGEHPFLAWAVAAACDWVRQHDSLDTDAPFAWYDMAVGLRAYRLGYLLDAAVRSDDVAADDVATLLRSVALHLEALADDERFAAHSNHGFYFAAGQLALARRLRMLPGADEHVAQAETRITRLLEAHYSVEGVHKEHSPDYHRMVTETFGGLLDAGLLDSETWGPYRERFEEALAWFVLPNGRIATFGDTPHLLIRRQPGTTTSDALAFVATGGAEGKPPAQTWRAFLESGYVVFRDGWPAGPDDQDDWSYLAQTAAFHSRTHKQADDLSFVWYDHGHEILIDPGRFGYLDPTTPDTELGSQGFYYSHPSRVYVESTHAHNTVEIDGRSYPRRKVRPYGSALVRAGEHGGVYWSEAHARQFQTVRHRRILLFRPRQWLLVLDWLHDNTEEQQHTYTQHFHFAPELEVRAEGDGFVADLPDARPLHVVPLLAAESLPPVRGRSEPELRGWLSREDHRLDPCWSAGFTAGGVRTRTFATLLAFGAPPSVQKESSTSQGRAYDLSWVQGDARHAVRVRAPQERPFELDYRVSFPEGL